MVTTVPDDLVVVGQVAGAYGVQGWVRIRPYSEDAETLLTVKDWWLEKPTLHAVQVLQVRIHNDEILVRLSTIQSREEAEIAKGTLIKVSRSLFPELEEDEFYWIDLIGLRVINLNGEQLGLIHDLMDNGVHQILRVKIDKEGDSEKRKEILIPFVEKFIHKVDLETKEVLVDWESDY